MPKRIIPKSVRTKFMLPKNLIQNDIIDSWVVMGKPTRVPISTLHAALVVSGVDMPIEEAECLVANMIYKGYMRGYVSHEKQMIVLAQQNTFPKVADAPVAVQLGMGNL